MKLNFRLTASAAALLSLSQPALAQSAPCIAPADLSDTLTYSMPLLVEGIQSSCMDALPADSFLLGDGAEFASGFEPLRDQAWPGTRRFLMTFAKKGDSKNQMSGIIEDLSDEAIRPFVDAMVVQLVAAEIKPANCGDIDRILPLLAPLPPENYGPILATLFSFVGDEEKDLKICKD